jgi:tRNA1Val (adenine37-N6)-methyltransferase
MKNNINSLLQLKKEGETVDDLLGGRLKIFQKEKGYRFSIDSLLLAHFVYLKRNDHVIDLGAGSSIISLILACRFESVKVVGVEIQAQLVDMARRSVKLNRLQSKIEIRQGDVKQINDFFDPQSFNVAVFNPPYRKLNSGRINPHEEKAIARHEIMGSLGNFLSSAKYLLRSLGHVFIIYPATRGAELFRQMRNNDIEPKRIRMVHSNILSSAEFILVEGIKNGGEELNVMPPLFIYGNNEKYTEEMEFILQEIF